MRNRISVLVGTALVACWALPAPAQERPALAIRNVKIVTLAGPAIESGTVVIQDGRITAVGTDVTVPAGARVIDGAGLEVYPGFFDASTDLGLTEVGAVDVTNDQRELGEFNPHLLGATAVHPASEHIPVARANGVTHAVATPSSAGGGMGGQGSLMNLAGWTVEEMLIRPSVGVMLSWPTMRGGGFGFGGFAAQQRSFRQVQEQYEEAKRDIVAWLDAARQYARARDAGDPIRRDLRLEAVARVLGGEIPFLVSATSQQAIRDAVAFADEQQVRIVLLNSGGGGFGGGGGSEIDKVFDLLAEKKIPVILGATQAMPGSDRRYDDAYSLPARVHAAGIKFALSTFSSSDSRTLPYEIGMAVGYGLPHEEALKAITRYPAEILGVGDELGTIEVGKRANLVVTDGDPLEIRTTVRHVIIDGVDVGVGNRHLELYEKYRARPLPKDKP